MKVIGIDMGGTNIRAGIINEQGKVFCKIHDYTSKSPNQILTKIHKMINHLNHYIKGSARAISLAIPGIIHPKSSEVLHAGDTVEGWKNVNEIGRASCRERVWRSEGWEGCRGKDGGDVRQKRGQDRSG